MAASKLDKASRITLLGLVNDAGVLPATAQLDYLAPAAPAASLQMLEGARMAEQYIDGSGTAESPFAVLLRIDPEDSAGRAEAFGVLSELADALELMGESGTLPEGFNSVVGVSTPILASRDDDGSEVWRASFVLEFARSATR